MFSLAAAVAAAFSAGVIAAGNFAAAAFSDGFAGGFAGGVPEPQPSIAKSSRTIAEILMMATSPHASAVNEWLSSWFDGRWLAYWLCIQSFLLPIDVAIWQFLLERLHTFVGDLRAMEMQSIEIGQAAEMFQAVVTDLRVVEPQHLKISQPAETFQAVVSDLRAIEPQLFKIGQSTEMF